MTLNILFLTITIKKRHVTTEEMLHEEKVEKLYNENKDRICSMHRLF